MNKYIEINNDIIKIENIVYKNNYVSFDIEKKTYTFFNKDKNVLENENEEEFVFLNEQKKLSNKKHYFTDELDFILNHHIFSEDSFELDSSTEIYSDMPGTVFKVLVNEGDDVKKDSPLIIIEAMKMEHMIKSTRDGKIKKVFVKESDQVGHKHLLISFCED